MWDTSKMPTLAADGTGLGQYALVLDGHLPPGELDHPRAGGDVAMVEGRALELEGRMVRRGCALLCHGVQKASRFRCDYAGSIL